MRRDFIGWIAVALCCTPVGVAVGGLDARAGHQALAATAAVLGVWCVGGAFVAWARR